MANKVLRLIYKVDDQTGGAFSKISMGIIGINQGLEIAKKAAEAAKKAFDFADEGAQLLLTEERFNRLAESIGTTGDVLAEELDIALKGTMSTMEGMALATDFLSLGLVKNQEEAIRLTKVAGDLGMNMNQLVLTLTNQTTMRFDSLGVAVDGFQEKVDKLKEAGYAADEAFRLAFVEQAEDQIAKVGAVADTAAGEFMQLKSAWTDYVDATKKGLAEAIVPAIRLINDSRDAQELMNEVVEKGIVAKEDEKEFIDQLILSYDDINDVKEHLTTLLEEEKEQYLLLNPELAHHLRLQQQSAVAAEELAEAKSWLDAATLIYTEGLTFETIAAWENVAALQAQAAAMRALAGGLEIMAPMLGGGYTMWEDIDPYAAAGGFATGGSFTVGGSGGTDSTPVSFMATPGETVSVGGGTSDMENVMAEIRRLVDSIPLAIADAIERR